MTQHALILFRMDFLLKKKKSEKVLKKIFHLKTFVISKEIDKVRANIPS